MASALATPHTATRPSSLSSSFGLSSSLSFVIMLLFWLFWLFWLVLLGFAFCSAFCSSSIFFRNSALCSFLCLASERDARVWATCFAPLREQVSTVIALVPQVSSHPDELHVPSLLLFRVQLVAHRRKLHDAGIVR